MSFNPQRRKKAYYAFSSIFKKQSADGTPLADEDLDERHNCTVEFSDQVEKEEHLDCEQADIDDEEVTAQFKTATLTYASITAQRLFGWICLLLSSTAAPTGTAQNEIQTATNADIDGGAAPMTFEFEGRTGTTGAIAYNASAATFQAALEALSSIGEGNVAVTGSLATGLAVEFQGSLAKANMPLLTFAAGFTDGGSPVTPVFVQTQAGGNKYHAAVRSTDDQLAKTSYGCGYDSVTAADPEKYFDQIVQSVSFTYNRRRRLSAVVTLSGRFTPADMESFEAPECVNPRGIHGRDCRIKINGSFLTKEFWSGTVTLNNESPTGDDAFPDDDIEIQEQQRGDQPRYPISMQILGSKGDTIDNLLTARAKVPIEFHLGKPGDRCSVILPQVKLWRASNPRPYVGELNRSAHGIDAIPHKDGTLKAPLRAEAYLDQTEQFLST
jgi:hypothetical protein